MADTRKITSGYRGVGWDAHRSAWKVQIASKVQGWRHVARRKTEWSAARGYDALARLMYGDDCHGMTLQNAAGGGSGRVLLNFPEEPTSAEDRAWAEEVVSRGSSKRRAGNAERLRREKAERAVQREAWRVARDAEVARLRAAGAAVLRFVPIPSPQELAERTVEDAFMSAGTWGTAEAAAVLGVSTMVLNRWEREGRVPAGRVMRHQGHILGAGLHKRYAKAALLAILEARGPMRGAYCGLDDRTAVCVPVGQWEPPLLEKIAPTRPGTLAEAALSEKEATLPEAGTGVTIPGVTHPGAGAALPGAGAGLPGGGGVGGCGGF